MTVPRHRLRVSTLPEAGKLTERLILRRRPGDSDHESAALAKAAFDGSASSRSHWAYVWCLTTPPRLVWEGWRPAGASTTRWIEMPVRRGVSRLGRLRRAIAGDRGVPPKQVRAGDRRSDLSRRRPDR